MKFIIKSEPVLLAELNTFFQTHPELYSRFGLPENGVLTAMPAPVADPRFNDIFLRMYGGKLVLLEGDVEACQQTFQSKYSAADGSQSFYQNLNFPWTDFSNMAVEGMDPATFVLGFIHRFDTASSRWWLTAQRFSMPAYSGSQSYTITSNNTFFDMPADGTVCPYGGGLQQGGGSMYDPTYFANVLCDHAPISNSTYVNRICNAWAELSQLFSENFAAIQGAEESGFSINFCSISSDYSSQIPGSVLVPFPHTIAMYMSYNGQPLLTNGAVVASSQFVNHAADMATMCPSVCNLYNWPAGLDPLS